VLSVPNTLAYYGIELFMVVKCFMLKAHGHLVKKLFKSISYSVSYWARVFVSDSHFDPSLTFSKKAREYP
jgi:hypothetical protein